MILSSEDRELLEDIKKNAKELGSCNDARDHGDETWAQENAPRFRKNISYALDQLSEPLRATPELVRWDRDRGDWSTLFRVVDRLLLPPPDLAILRRIRAHLDSAMATDDGALPDDDLKTVRTAIGALLDQLTQSTRDKIKGVELWTNDKVSWHVASDALWLLAVNRGEGTFD